MDVNWRVCEDKVSEACGQSGSQEQQTSKVKSPCSKDNGLPHCCSSSALTALLPGQGPPNKGAKKQPSGVYTPPTSSGLPLAVSGTRSSSSLPFRPALVSASTWRPWGTELGVMEAGHKMTRLRPWRPQDQMLGSPKLGGHSCHSSVFPE